MDSLQEAYTRFDQFASQAMRAYNTPGMVVALTDRERLLRVSAYGYADLARGIPMIPETRCEIGSDGKHFTSLALLRQVEAGRLDLHAPVTRYLPWFAVQSRHAPITVHHLLSHTAGIINGSEFATDAGFEVWDLRHTETAYAPGAHHYYSDLGYKILGLVLERVTGRPYAEVIRSDILDPLEMDASEAVITHHTRPTLAMGYRSLYDDRPLHREHPLVPAPWVETNTGDGCIVSTAVDFAAYVRMLLNRGQGPRGRLVSAASFDAMTAPIGDSGHGWHYGYGLITTEVEGAAYLMHGGDMPGYQSTWRADLDHGLAAVTLMNGPLSPGVPAYALALLRAAYDGRELPPLPAGPEVVANAADYAGTYRSAGHATGSRVAADLEHARMIGAPMAGEGAFTLSAEGERLVMSYDGARVTLERRGEDAFYVAHPAFDRFLLSFERADDRVVAACHGPDWYVNERYEGPERFDYPPGWDAFAGHYRTHNPWYPNVRVVVRKGALWLVEPSGDEEPLVPLGDGTFRVGAEEHLPERISFDAIVNGQAQRARLSRCDYYRFFTP